MKGLDAERTEWTKYAAQFRTERDGYPLGARIINLEQQELAGTSLLLSNMFTRVINALG